MIDETYSFFVWYMQLHIVPFSSLNFLLKYYCSPSMGPCSRILIFGLKTHPYAQRALSTYAYAHTQSKKFSRNPKISLQIHYNPKNISSFFIPRNLCKNKKYPETMQIEVRIASIEPRNISITMFGVKKYHEHGFSLRERSFLKLGTGVEEFLEGCQIILPRLIGVSKILAKTTKYLMGCEIFGTYI